MLTERKVVVTGIGATTPVGSDAATTWANLRAGVSGVRSLGGAYEDYEIPARFAGVAMVDPAEQLERVEARKLDRSEQFALIAAREAWADAGKPEVDLERLSVIVSSGIGGAQTLLDAADVLRERGWSRISPNSVPMLMPNGPTATVALDLKARGGVHSPVSACASGAEAIAWASMLIQLGRADVVVAGGCEAAIHPVPVACFAAMRALSTRNDDPQRASRPYDVDRDGFVMGEGSGVLVLESEESAKARGARIYGYVAGFGMTADGHHIAQPDPSGSGAARAMMQAMNDAGITAADVAHINAHATSTPAGDVAEAHAIHAALGAHARNAIVTATKSMTGHLLGGAGALESIATLLALRDRVVPPTINLDNQDPEIDLHVATSEYTLAAGELHAINNSFGFGGHDVALVFRSA
ncbi:MAG: beta-ketoacyl-[acyl-carrier-protein] synthase II [Actinobacteria bacterium]|nr:beta-ketoacyl-[acyl-carrier-protein] synthase II [Actinomycetota bacterium]